MHKKILDHLSEAILLFNRQLVLTYINSAGEALLADSSKHLVGRGANDIFKFSTQLILTHLQQSLTNNEVLVDREIILDNLKQNITVNLSITPLLGKGDRDEILVELQQLDQHLRITKEEQLVEQYHISRILIRGLAHEIKNPLGGIRGAAQLLELELEGDELKEYTQIIIAEADRLKDLMDKMLGPNRPPQKNRLNIHQVLERVRQLVTAEMTGNIDIECDYDPSIPFLHADKNQLIQAFLNIVRNAIQAIDETGKVILKTRVHRKMTIGRKHYKLLVKIDIIDNGIGIKEDMLRQIFYPMITGRADGTGLGLSISQSLINQHNGVIECYSKPNNTVFSIYLPLETSNVSGIR
ncbi:MAG: nitrogen regulation protein NR(II) [Methylococcales bacterium]|nr:nitrogen regulation protein NR(II) [Methylococcales bacterium]